jgi:tetratricopeptide (TPR) repeat protein
MMTIAQKFQITLLLAFSTSIGSAQINRVNYGEAPDECKKQLTIMVTYHKQKAYESALKSWRWCFNNCPQGSKNIYIVGEKIFSNKINEFKNNKELRSRYIDTLLMIYDYRIKYFPGNTSLSKFKTLGKKGKIIATYRYKTDYEEAYKILDTVVNNSGNNVSVGVANAYIFTVKKMIQNGKIECEKMIFAYTKILNIVKANIKTKPKSYTLLKEKAIQTAHKCLDCHLLDSLYTEDFEKFKSDTIWLDGGIELLNDKTCKTSDIRMKMMEKRYETAPSAKTAINLAQFFLSQGNNEKASKFFNKGIEMEKDSSKLVNYYLKNAQFQNESGNPILGMASAKKALLIEPINASAYSIMGDAIIYGGAKSCKDLQFGGGEVYWVAVDYYNKAAALAIEETVKKRVINNANKYSAYFPMNNVIFMEKVKEGDSYQVGCWINANTTVRNKK